MRSTTRRARTSHSECFVHLDGAARLQYRTSLGARGRVFQGFGSDDRITAELRGSAFAEMWMLADAPATNVAGRDAVRAAAQLPDPAGLRLWLRAKHLVLASFVGPIAAIVTVIIGIVQHRYDMAAAVAITLLFLPLGVLSVAAWFGLWLPYHPRKLLWRWEHRSDWRAALLRWIFLVLLPFLVVPVIGLVLLMPNLIIWLIAHQGHPPHEIPPAGLWLGTLVSVAVSLIVFGWAPGVAAKIARRRQGQLRGYLSDPEQG